MELSGEIVGVIVGSVFTGIIGILIVRYTEHREKKRTKEHTSRCLLSESEANQNRLQPLSDSCAKVLGSNNKYSEEDTLPNELSFDRTLYSALADKIGSLGKSVEKVVQYYVEIKYIEEQYKKLEFIHGVPLSYLLVIELKDKTGNLNYNNNSLGWDEIEEFLRHTEKVYDLGKELIKCLKWEIKQ